MLLAPKLFRYDRPEGRNPEAHPEVIVRRQVSKLNQGVPEVDYDNLTTLFQHELLGFPPDEMPVASLYHAKVHPPKALRVIDPYAFRIGRVLHINTCSEDSPDSELSSYDVMERLIRRAAIYSLARTHQLPPRDGYEKRQTAYTAAIGIVALSAVANGEAGTAVFAAGAATFFGINLVNTRLEGFNSVVERTVRELVPLHRDDIAFS